MTRDEVLSMKPGRELNVLVAEKVMGYEVSKMWDGCVKEKGRSVVFPTPKYSTEISAAWEAWEHGTQENWRMTVTKANGKYLALIIEVNREKGHRTVAQVEADTAEEAMSKCRLLALMEG